MWTSAWTDTHTHTHTHTHRHTHTRMHAKANRHTRSPSTEWCMGFTFRQLGGRDRHFSPSANSCFRQNNKRLNDIVSCPLWLRCGNGTTALRQQLQMARLYERSLFLSLSCASTETLADLKDRLISIESCWSVLKRQSITTYRGRARWSRANEKAEHKLRGSFGMDGRPQSGRHC